MSESYLCPLCDFRYITDNISDHFNSMHNENIRENSYTYTRSMSCKPLDIFLIHAFNFWFVLRSGYSVLTKKFFDNVQMIESKKEILSNYKFCLEVQSKNGAIIKRKFVQPYNFFDLSDENSITTKSDIIVDSLDKIDKLKFTISIIELKNIQPIMSLENPSLLPQETVYNTADEERNIERDQRFISPIYSLNIGRAQPNEESTRLNEDSSGSTYSNNSNVLPEALPPIQDSLSWRFCRNTVEPISTNTFSIYDESARFNIYNDSDNETVYFETATPSELGASENCINLTSNENSTNTISTFDGSTRVNIYSDSDFEAISFMTRTPSEVGDFENSYVFSSIANLRNTYINEALTAPDIPNNSNVQTDSSDSDTLLTDLNAYSTSRLPCRVESYPFLTAPQAEFTRPDINIFAERNDPHSSLFVSRPKTRSVRSLINFFNELQPNSSRYSRYS